MRTNQSKARKCKKTSSARNRAAFVENVPSAYVRTFAYVRRKSSDMTSQLKHNQTSRSRRCWLRGARMLTSFRRPKSGANKTAGSGQNVLVIPAMNGKWQAMRAIQSPRQACVSNLLFVSLTSLLFCGVDIFLDTFTQSEEPTTDYEYCQL